ncbi:hypothetical protein ACBI99_43420 [Nonomuraea sp. ATR24]|uniref:hypothetical protein n=1 Tax=Nonomuraea sp. ATR24 TaxID=1676744 RepID=UPI0035C06A54
MTVLVREAAQNSWDARLPDGAIEFRIDIRTLGDDAHAWRDLLLPQPPSGSNVNLDAALRPETVVLVVSDRNTRGLGGPLRAGERAHGEETPDFVQFLRNVGEPSDHRFGGGTYGFGKGIFYQLSNAGAILVDTHTATDGPAARRLMGAALGNSWYLGEQCFTGRHWWGLVAPDNIPDPILAGQADTICKALRLPGFDDGSSGTDIVVLAADLGSIGSESDTRDRTPEEAATFISSAILWNLWPKMVPDRHGRHMRFAVGVNGSYVPVPEPHTLDELAPFVEALEEIRAGNGAAFSRTVPPKHAGSFAMILTAASSASNRLLIEAAKPFDGPSHHVARMRVAELVVDYLAGSPHPDPHLAYAGVFKASEDADALFASAEPPTHDDWISKGLTGTARGVVVGARTFVQKQLDERLGLGYQSGGTGGQGLGQLSALLAGIVPARLSQTSDDGVTAGDFGHASETRGAGLHYGSGGGRDGGGGATLRRRGRPRLHGTPILLVHEGNPYLVAHVKVPAVDTKRVLSADVDVVLEGGGRESEPPIGAAVPQITLWQSADGFVTRGKIVTIPAGDESDWYVYATHVPDAVVRFRVNEVASDAG